MTTQPHAELSAERARLTPCPWCAAGTTLLKENGRQWQGMCYSEPISVSVQHWCEALPGQPSRMIERIGRDEESAIAAWNRRDAPAPADRAARVAALVVEAKSAAREYAKALSHADHCERIGADVLETDIAAGMKSLAMDKTIDALAQLAGEG